MLDLILPDMSGIAVLRQIKKTTRDLLVMMMTAHAQGQTAIEAIKLVAARLKIKLPPDVAVDRKWTWVRPTGTTSFRRA